MVDRGRERERERERVREREEREWVGETETVRRRELHLHPACASKSRRSLGGFQGFLLFVQLTFKQYKSERVCDAPPKKSCAFWGCPFCF